MKQQKYNLDIVHFYEMLGKFFYQRVWTIMKDTNGLLHNNLEAILIKIYFHIINIF
jgi:hypothetical protein